LGGRGFSFGGRETSGVCLFFNKKTTHPTPKPFF